MNPRADGSSSDSRQLWDRLYEEETRWLADYLGRSAPAEAVPDLVQEVWLSFWAARDRHQDTGRRRGFLRRLADRRTADWHRATERRRTVQPQFAHSCLTEDPDRPDVPAPPDEFLRARRRARTRSGGNRRG